MGGAIMASPFPGMDPYIEACNLWGDFHNALIAELHRLLSVAVPQGYVVRTGERSYISLVESEEKKERHFEPDVIVTANRGRKVMPPRESHSAESVATAELEPIVVRAFIDEEFVETFLDIYTLEPERRLVTSIEVLSPSNKVRGGAGWKKYLRKRQALLLGRANLVEIDLLRGGERMPMLDPMPSSPFYILVAHEAKAPICRVWPTFFDRPLPTIPIPLTRPDPDIALALQPMVEAIYQRSRYAQDIDYTRPLDPPLSPEQIAWLQERVRADKPVKPSAPKRRRTGRK
jgi:hypothetical protein